MKTTLKLQKTAILAVLILALSISVNAQSKGSGNLVKQDRTVTPFTEIEAGSAFQITLLQEETTRVTVETDDNYLEKILTSVENNRLIISSTGMRNPTAMKIYISTPDVTRIKLEGAARLDSEEAIQLTNLDIEASGASKITLNLDVQALKSEISGAARVNLDGKAISHNANISGASSLYAMDLTTQTTSVNVSGAAKAKVYAVSEIKANISGAGSLTYFDKEETPKISEPGSYTFQFDNPENPDDSEPAGEITGAEPGDSTLINIGDLEVKVYEGDPTTIRIGDRELEVDEEGNVDFKRKKNDKFDGHWGGFDIGINGFMNKDHGFDIPGDQYDFLDLRYEKSINVALNLIEQNFNLIGNNFGLTTGLGFEWNNYRFDNNMKLDRDSTGITGTYLSAEGINYTKSKLVVNYLTLPVLFEYQTNRFSNKNSFHISAGVLAGLRIGAHTKMAYNDGAKQKDKYKDRNDYDINPFKLDLTARIGYAGVNLYANYSLTTLFKENRGPELYPFAVGITLSNW